MFSFGSLISALALRRAEERCKEDRRDRAIRDLYTAIVESKAALNDINEKMKGSGKEFSTDFERRRERSNYINSDRLRLVALHWAQAEVSLKYFDHEVGLMFADWNKVRHWLEGLKTPEEILRFKRATLEDAENALKKLMDEQFK